MECRSAPPACHKAVLSVQPPGPESKAYHAMPVAHSLATRYRNHIYPVSIRRTLSGIPAADGRILSLTT